MSNVTFIDAAAKLEIKGVAGNIGAEVQGIRLTGDLHPSVIQAIKEALWRHKVLFFRDQNHLDDVGQEQMTAQFGEILDHPTIPVVAGTRHITELDSRRKENADFWHTDMTYSLSPTAASFLRAVVVPECGGDTMWANTAAAYASLSDDLRELADRLRVVHSNVRDSQEFNSVMMTLSAPHYSSIYQTEHPLVRIHPFTGERTILLGTFANKFIGYSGYDSQNLFRIFQDTVTRPEHIVRWRWRAGDVAIWDNCATQHYAIKDFGDQTRIMRRTTIVGQVPVGVDGRPSHLHAKMPNPLQAKAAAL